MLGFADAVLSVDDLRARSGEGADEVSGSDGEAPRSDVLRPDGPSADLFRALDIEMPQVGGQWQDDDLERVIREIRGLLLQAAQSSPVSDTSSKVSALTSGFRELSRVFLAMGCAIKSASCTSLMPKCWTMRRSCS